MIKATDIPRPGFGIGLILLLVLMTVWLPARRRVEPDIEQRFQHIVQQLRPEAAARLDGVVRDFNRELMRAGGEAGIQGACQRHTMTMMSGASGSLNQQEAAFAMLVQSSRDMASDLQQIQDELVQMKTLQDKLRDAAQRIRSQCGMAKGGSGYPAQIQPGFSRGDSTAMAGAGQSQPGVMMSGQVATPEITSRLGIAFYPTPQWQGLPEIAGMSRGRLLAELAGLEDLQGKVAELERINNLKLRTVRQRQSQLLNVLAQAHTALGKEAQGSAHKIR